MVKVFSSLYMLYFYYIYTLYIHTVYNVMYEILQYKNTNIKGTEV